MDFECEDIECRDIKSLDDLIVGLKSGSYEELLRVGTLEYEDENEIQFKYEINVEKREVVITAHDSGGFLMEDSEVFLVREDTLIVKPNLTKVGQCIPSVLRHCAFLKKLRFEEGCKSIAYKAFFDFYYLTSVEFNEDLEEIDALAFKNCQNLREVRFPKNLHSICFGAFYGCSSLEKVEMTGDVVKIEHTCFSNCSNLRSVKTNGSLKCLDLGIFDGCLNLEKIDGLESVIRVGSRSFCNCKALKELHLPSVTLMVYYVFTDCDALELIEVSADINLDSLHKATFTLPKQVKLAFHGTGLTMTNEEYESLLEKVESLEEKPETVCEALRILYPEEFVVKGFEESKTTDEVEETSLF